MDRIVAVSRIQALIDLHTEMRRRSKYDDLSDLADDSLDFVFRSQGLLDEIAPDSSYASEAEHARNMPTHLRVPVLAAAMRALIVELSPPLAPEAADPI